MEISFDDDKRVRTLRERGLDFVDAALVFTGRVHTAEDLRSDYGERRFTTYGLLRDRMVLLVWTETPDGRRIISMRKANEREQARYREQLG